MKISTTFLISLFAVQSSFGQFLAGDGFSDWFSAGMDTRPISRRSPTVEAPTVEAPTRPRPPTPPAAPVAPVVPPPAPFVPPSPLNIGTSNSFAGHNLNQVFNDLQNQVVAYNRNISSVLPDVSIGGASMTLQPVVSSVQSDDVQSRPLSRRSPTLAGFDDWFSAGTQPRPVMPSTILTTQGVKEINLNVTGWGYLVLQWGDVNHHFYVGDSSGVQTFKGTAPLSSYTYFQSMAPVVASVPEAGSTLMLLLGSLAIVGYFRKIA